MSTLLAGLKHMTRPRISREKSSKYVISSHESNSSPQGINWSHLRREALKKKSYQSTIVNLYADNLSKEAGEIHEGKPSKRDSELCISHSRLSDSSLNKRSRLGSSCVQETRSDTDLSREGLKEPLSDPLKLNENIGDENMNDIHVESASNKQRGGPELKFAAASDIVEDCTRIASPVDEHVEHGINSQPTYPEGECAEVNSGSVGICCSDFDLISENKEKLPSLAHLAIPPNINTSEPHGEGDLAQDEIHPGRRHTKSSYVVDSKSSTFAISR
jgi:hypothetical protein